MSNCRCLRVFKPVVRDVISLGEDDSRSGRVYGLAIAVPVLQLSGVVVIGTSSLVNVDEVTGEVIGVCRDAPLLNVGIAKRHTQVMGKEIVSLPNKDFPSQWQDERSFIFIRARNNGYLMSEVTVVGQAMQVSFALLRVRLSQ